ncbi:conjugative transposon protein TraK [Echinicola vietnamensis]|uniref:Conjugative transposon TraK protein n=1 Tax=Echinicola vietnamensis (strain DSM 17526 / LMG 23754 / KMM 6221) TaxID=926556 RepID=L0FZL3_ECHVK|nr:conjugative transposon protein TraK [Echinicola vietnamensis]AGA78196.1 conjugative transposon TraK protein [Echinicola vietnamensis DSM 17526]
MFKNLQNIDSAFKHIRLLALGIMAGSLLVTGFVSYQAFELVRSARERIYILAEGKALKAFSAQRKDNIPVEAKDHIKMFHHYFFTLSPDDRHIKEQVGKSLYMADASAKAAYDNLRESGYYTRMVSANINQTLHMDSVAIDTGFHPYGFTYYGTQRIIRPTSIVTRRLVTRGQLRHVDRSDRNPHGFLIEKWETLRNENIKVEKR